MSALRKLISGSCRGGACGRHMLEAAPHDQVSVCRLLHGSPALLKSPAASATSQQVGRAGLRTSLPLTKPVVDRSAEDQPRVRVDPGLLNLQQAGERQSRSQPGREGNQSRDSGHQ